MQFGPGNKKLVTRDWSREMKHTGNINTYIKQFSSLMLEFRDMHEKDKVYAFINNIQQWENKEVMKQRFQSLVAVIIIVKKLLD